MNTISLSQIGGVTTADIQSIVTSRQPVVLTHRSADVAVLIPFPRSKDEAQSLASKYESIVANENGPTVIRLRALRETVRDRIWFTNELILVTAGRGRWRGDPIAVILPHDGCNTARQVKTFIGLVKS